MSCSDGGASIVKFDGIFCSEIAEKHDQNIAENKTSKPGMEFLPRLFLACSHGWNCFKFTVDIAELLQNTEMSVALLKLAYLSHILQKGGTTITS